MYSVACDIIDIQTEPLTYVPEAAERTHSSLHLAFYPISISVVYDSIKESLLEQ